MLTSARSAKGHFPTRIAIAVLLVLVSCALALDRGICAEETAEHTTSGPLHHRGQKENNIPAVETYPSAGQSKNEWESYFEYIGKLKIELPLDGFAVRDVWVQAHATFRIVVQFHIGEDHHPKDIQLAEGERHIDADAAKACLTKWTLSGLLPNKKYSLVLIWEHGKGYSKLALTGDQMSLEVKLRTLI